MYTISFLVLETTNLKKDSINTIKVDNKETNMKGEKFTYLSLEIERSSIIYVNDKKVNLRENISIIETLGCKLLVTKGIKDSYSFSNDPLTNKIIGHRGFGMNKYSSIPENTLYSFNTALDKVEWVEMDVQLGINNVPVVYHDFFRGEVIFKDDPTSPSTLDYVLKNIKEGGGINMEIKYPLECDTLFNNMDVINRDVNNMNIRDNVDLNNRDLNNNELDNDQVKVPYDIPTLVDSILQVIYNNKYRKIIFSSFSPSVLLYLKIRVPEAKLLLITDSNEERLVEFCIKTGISGMVFDHKVLTEETVKRINKSLEVYVYDVMSKEEYERCRELEVTGIITDKIEDLLYN